MSSAARMLVHNCSYALRPPAGCPGCRNWPATAVYSGGEVGAGNQASGSESNRQVTSCSPMTCGLAPKETIYTLLHIIRESSKADYSEERVNIQIKITIDKVSYL
jgi:hypothetical protein